MTFYQMVGLPLLFGLVGFVEPCSIGINMLFLASARNADPRAKTTGVFVFMLVRASLLALLGLSVAILGAWLFSFQSWYFLVFGLGYAIAGIWLLLGKGTLSSAPGMARFSTMVLDGSQPSSPILLGLLGGLTIPACAIPLVVLLLGQSLLAGEMAAGFVSLLVFGLALTAPLLFFLWHGKGQAVLAWMAGKANSLRNVAAIGLILIGVLTMASSYYWMNAL